MLISENESESESESESENESESESESKSEMGHYIRCTSRCRAIANGEAACGLASTGGVV